MKLFLAPLFGMLPLLAACTPVQEEPRQATAGSSARSCFWPSQVTGFNDVHDRQAGSNRILVSVGANDTYLFETFGSCPDLSYAETIGFDQNGAGQICNGVDVNLVVPGPAGTQRCAVRMIRELTPAEVAAMK